MGEIIGRPTIGNVKKVSIKMEETILTHVARIFERDPKLSKLEKRDDTNRIRFLLEEFIRSDGKCINWYQEEKPKLESRLNELEKKMGTLTDVYNKGISKMYIKELPSQPSQK